MSLLGRFFSPRDLKLIGSLNQELLGDVVQSTITIYKMCAEQTKTNIYGESSVTSGKMFYPGVEMTAWIDKAEIDTSYDQFGPDRNQTVVYKMLESDLKLVNIYPEIGDLILFGNIYFEINNVIQMQFLGGIPDKSLSIIVNTNYTRISKISLVDRQV